MGTIDSTAPATARRQRLALERSTSWLVNRPPRTCRYRCRATPRPAAGILQRPRPAQNTLVRIHRRRLGRGETEQRRIKLSTSSRIRRGAARPRRPRPLAAAIDVAAGAQIGPEGARSTAPGNALMPTIAIGSVTASAARACRRGGRRGAGGRVRASMLSAQAPAPRRRRSRQTGDLVDADRRRALEHAPALVGRAEQGRGA